MKQVLATTHAEILAQFAWSRVLLAFDFDGTLAPIVADRESARMRVRTRKLLERLCRLYPCAIISGRGQDDVKDRLDGLPIEHIMGNHGLEPGQHMSTFEKQVTLARPKLEAALRGLSGLDIEDKRFSLAIHYRRSRRRTDARRAIHNAIFELPVRMRLIPGKLVVNVIPMGAPHKGDALILLRTQVGADTAIYVGDDVTDEDVFELDQPGRLLGIRVGRSKSSAATYYLRNQREVDDLLERLVELRAVSQAVGR